jgi:quinoprotein relay system zinc metallohydrolase 2
MFEAILTLCLDLDAGPCRDQLLPGYEAATESGCQSALAARPPAAPDGPSSRGAARCAPVGAALAVTEVVPGVFVHQGAIAEPDANNRGDVANIGFIIGTASVAVVDTGSARWIGEGLWRAIRAETTLPVSHVILTHMHPDHVLGTAPFVEAGAEVVGHAGLARALADRAATYEGNLRRLVGEADFIGTAAPAIDRGVADRDSIDLGDRVLDLVAWPVAHTGTDLTVLDSTSGTLFAGDLVFHRHAPALDGRLTGWRPVLDGLAAQGFSGVVPGHGDALLDWPEGATDVARYLAQLEADTRAVLAQGGRLSDAVASVAADEAPRWDLFDVFNPRNATVAFTELEWE